ncbi:MAG: hypothetical protein GW906_07815 [Epsilonproteobacteria bacterium]|nr:hypothetical protein [Campylobacterota bacterium]OIO17966.1 MAG: hypothetical protein AUJ81_00370 [Helicobacteraceae bacterium CG1_02_36_14]PIP09974.1 MAG: hypothetical protein COX50_08020 [Sulfurimonas sp. CG23_combo_of_CG06-09_8_20_14_all_36_33]PIS25213.1 MAG: hypothetical protein COT46_06625 [Sulfurimonas sp. CG08_land_8_20_14_0_20_36_33]PIU35347.1 MAG: hypothetical protein COT05_03680 [Sulfurimonas sp. CG07_land_8_20_14_0_80_36_56]PIV05164.1 MAG: hypothetical protein COS56_02365 [Sulfur
MKPLFAKDLEPFLDRFSHFRDTELRHVEIVSPTVISVLFAVQDRARDFDWITVELEFNGVSDAKLIDSSKLSFLDMSEGLNILYEENTFAFGIGRCDTKSSIQTSTCYIVSSSLKYKQGSF